MNPNPPLGKLIAMMAFPIGRPLPRASSSAIHQFFIDIL
jgi:hypothetical protein